MLSCSHTRLPAQLCALLLCVHRVRVIARNLHCKHKTRGAANCCLFLRRTDRASHRDAIGACSCDARDEKRLEK